MIIIFYIEFDISYFTIYLSKNKLKKAIKAIAKILS